MSFIEELRNLTIEANIKNQDIQELMESMKQAALKGKARIYLELSEHQKDTLSIMGFSIQPIDEYDRKYVGVSWAK